MTSSFLKNKEIKIKNKIDKIDEDKINDEVEEEEEIDDEEEIDNEEEIDDEVEEEIEEEIDDEVEEEIEEDDEVIDEDDIEDDIEDNIEDDIEDDIESEIQEIDSIDDESIENEIEDNNETFIEDNEIKFQKIIKRRKNIFGYKLINNLKHLKISNNVEKKSSVTLDISSRHEPKTIQQLRENNKMLLSNLLKNGICFSASDVIAQITFEECSFTFNLLSFSFLSPV